MRLEDVIALMRGRDQARAGLRGHLRERGVAHVARGRLGGEAESAGLRAGVLEPRGERELEPPRLPGDEGEVAIRLPRSPPVVDVRHGEEPSRLGDDLGRAVQQGERVRAARHGQEHRGAARDQAGLRRALEGREDRVHAFMVRHLAAPSSSSGLTCRFALAYEDGNAWEGEFP